LGPFRQPPQRRYDTRGVTPTEVGASGELTIPLIVNEIIRKRKRPHIEKVLKWLQLLNLSRELKLNREGTSDIFKIELKTHDEAPITTPVDVGYGISQVLPVLVQCSFLEYNSTLLLEQPELHLHPEIQSTLADILIQTAYEKNSILLIETHSERLVNGMFEAIRSKQLKHTDMNLITVNHIDDSIQIGIHQPDIYGEVDFNWHKHFCSDY
jgi:predicted ATPase